MSGAVNTLMGSKQSTGALAVSIAPATVVGYVYTYGTATSSTAVTSVISGGVAPYTYAWTCTGSIVPTNPTYPNTTFYESFSSFGSDTQTATVTVTDSKGNTGTATVSVVLNCTLYINVGSLGFL